MLTRHELVKGLRKLHPIRARDPVPEELRGWNYHAPPVRPRAYLGLSIWEAAYRYCDSKRDLYMRRVVKAKGDYDRPQLSYGNSIHRVVARASRDARDIVMGSENPVDALPTLLSEAKAVADEICGSSSGYSEFCRKLYSYLILMWSAEIVKARVSYGGDALGWIPWISEIRVDGTAVGLSDRLSIDAVMDLSLILEIKTGYRQYFHRVGLAGYALAVESSLEIPIDYGALIYINGFHSGEPEIRVDTVYISPELRKEFIDQRDEAIEIIMSGSDPGLASECPNTCPFLEACGVRK